MIEPSPEEIEARIQYLDSIAREDELPPEWFDQASERVILQLFIIRSLLLQGSFEDAIRCLTLIPSMAKRIMANAVASLPREQVVEMLKNKLEVMSQQPVSVFSDVDGVVGFRFDDVEVPDHYVEPPAS